MYGLKLFIRSNESFMNFLAFIYRLVGFNYVRGRKGLKLSWSGAFCKKIRIISHGKNNQVVIGKGCRLRNCAINIYGDHNRVIMQNDCVGHELDMWISEGSMVKIGEHTHFAGNIHLAATEGKEISIGERSLFASEIVVRTGDSHSVLDANGNRINQAKNVAIGNHVWTGQNVTVLKGSFIGNDCIIGACSLVSGKIYPNNCVIAGNPAKVIKTEVTWDPQLL